MPLFASGDPGTRGRPPRILDLQVPDPVVSPPASMNYYVLVSNACGAADSAHVEVVEVLATAWADTTICPGGSVTLMASGRHLRLGAGHGPPDPGSASPLCTPEESATYTVVVTVGPGCTDSAQVTVDLHPMPVVDAGPDQVIEFGDAAQLMATGLGSFSWSPDQDPTCNGCPDPVVSPPDHHLHRDAGRRQRVPGHRPGDRRADGTLYVPNSFTPMAMDGTTCSERSRRRSMNSGCWCSTDGVRRSTAPRSWANGGTAPTWVRNRPSTRTYGGSTSWRAPERSERCSDT